MLLESLADVTPTRLRLKSEFMMMGFGSTMESNPLNPVERRVLTDPWVDDDDDCDDVRVGATIKVGADCFVAIGQIVGRPYAVIRYQPTGIIIINSQVESKKLRERVRAVWAGDDPAATLMNSLLIDYATEGKFNGRNLNNWSECSDRQCEAAMRLLFYFPKEAAPLIAARLRTFDVRKDDSVDAWMKRDVRNGARVLDFIQAVAWSNAPEVRGALAKMR